MANKNCTSSAVFFIFIVQCLKAKPWHGYFSWAAGQLRLHQGCYYVEFFSKVYFLDWCNPFLKATMLFSNAGLFGLFFSLSFSYFFLMPDLMVYFFHITYFNHFFSLAQKKQFCSIDKFIASKFFNEFDTFSC